MKKLVWSLSALFCIIFGTITVWAEKREGTVKRYEENVEEKIAIVFHEGSEEEEIAKAVQEKVGGELLEIQKSATKEQLKSASLVLLGTREWKETEEILDRLPETAKISLFFVGEEEKELLRMEERLRQELQTEENKTGKESLKQVPGLWLTWEEGEREEELSYIDGWLTTAFTY